MENTIAVVIPVFQGERSLPEVIRELVEHTKTRATAKGRKYRVAEVFLVHDGAIDQSAEVIADLSARHPFVTAVWLSRNFGQHPATLAGMSKTTADWVVTMDEDGQHDPADIGRLLDRAFECNSPLVYALPGNRPPQGLYRNTCSRLVKILFTTLLGHRDFGHFSSYRLIEGQIARSLGAYCGPNVYLDAALPWLVGRSGSCLTALRSGFNDRSGYTFSKLVKHLLRLVVTSGTRPLRLIFLFGFFSIFLSFLISAYVVYEKLANQIATAGWSSLMVVFCFFSGCILLALGVVAEYLGITLQILMGRPLYVELAKSTFDERERNAA